MNTTSPDGDSEEAIRYCLNSCTACKIKKFKKGSAALNIAVPFSWLFSPERLTTYQLTFHWEGASKTLGRIDRTYSSAAAGVMFLYSTYKLSKYQPTQFAT